MPMRGVFLTHKEVQHLAYFLQCVWYNVVIPDRPWRPVDIRALEDFKGYFGGEAYEGPTDESEARWPWYWDGSDDGRSDVEGK